ncbi:MAG: hypothetical protein QM605_12315, partial [Sphingobium sp.]
KTFIPPMGIEIPMQVVVKSEEFPDGLNVVEAEMRFYWEQIPNWRAVEAHIFPTEDSVAIYWTIEGEPKDTPRARSLELAGKTLRCDEVDIWTFNEEEQLTRHVLIVTASEGLFHLCSDHAQIDTEGVDAYIDELTRTEATGTVVDPNKPTKPHARTPQWFVDGKVIPMPSAR